MTFDRHRNHSLTRLYDELCDHYRMEPTRNNRGIAHENGAIEAAHGHLKNRIKQAIYLRGSSDFASLAEYQALIEQAVAALNRQCASKFELEKSVLQPLPQVRVPDYEVLTARVSTRSTIEVRCILYSVPSRLIGQSVEIHLYHDRLVGYLGTHPVFELPRLRVKGGEKRRGRCVNYRHVIEGLRRKPRAFLYCTWQQDLLPNVQFRSLWERLKAQFELDQAAVLLVEALYIAATQDKEQAVAEYLEGQLKAQTLSLQRLQQQFLPSVAEGFPSLDIEQHSLASYDQLLPSSLPNPRSESILEPQPAAQGPTSITHTYPLGVYRDPGYTGALVLCVILAGFVRRRNPTSSLGAAPTRPQRSPTPQRKKFFQL